MTFCSFKNACGVLKEYSCHYPSVILRKLALNAESFMLKTFSIFLSEMYMPYAEEASYVITKCMVCTFLQAHMPSSSGLWICSIVSNWTKPISGTRAQGPWWSMAKTWLWRHLVKIGRLELPLWRLTCFPCCRFQIITLSTLRSWVLVATGLSRFSRSITSSNFKRCGTKSVFRASMRETKLL